MTFNFDPRAIARSLYAGEFRPMFIGGRWIGARSDEVLAVTDPASGQPLASVPRGGAADIDDAVKAARAAFEGEWSTFTPYDRQCLLLRIADMFEERWNELCVSDTLDMGLPLARTLGNRRRVIGMLRFYAGQATALHGDTISNSVSNDIVTFTRREPVGVVGAIIPWNAPTAASIWKIAPALATGCTVVLKPSEEAPLTPLLIAKIMQEAGTPDGVVNVVTGTGAEAGAALASHPDVNKIVFTGSTATGQTIARAGVDNLKHVSLELGGKSPMIICRDADLEKAVPTAAMAVYAHSGQICIAGSRLFVDRAIHGEFLERLAAYAEGLRLGHGLDSDTDLGPLINARQAAKVETYIASARSEGAELVTGGARLAGAAYDGGNFIAPTVFGGVRDEMTIAREEIFGPVISAMPFDTLDEAVTRANATPYGLAAGVFTRDLGTAHKMVKRLKAGSVWVNMYHAIDPAVPFGGVKMSGYGREGGIEHLGEYLETKAVWIQTA
ncbi:aldehyde dehydrogenase family protein [Acuticoccus sediminis]|uniref:aldehyde dehydrogenase family protein n=1 Tax=Acuticoccus sediminis TaxID=2184697 RepID=UPI001CFF44FB|nr:aldehyde dehydrogenase family protein [Acuticoccus sediminis]